MPEPLVDGSRKARLPWDQQEKEPPKAYQHFVAYRDAGRGRTIYDLADRLHRARGYLYQLSRDWKWVRRAEAWDHEQDRIFAEKMADRRKHAAQNALLIIGAARTKLVERLQTMDVSSITPTQWIQWFEVLFRVEREAMGQPSTTVAHTGADGGPIQAQVEGLTDEARKQFFAALIAEAQSRAGLVTAEDDEPHPAPPMTEHGSTVAP